METILEKFKINYVIFEYNYRYFSMMMIKVDLYSMRTSKLYLFFSKLLLIGVTKKLRLKYENWKWL